MARTTGTHHGRKSYYPKPRHPRGLRHPKKPKPDPTPQPPTPKPWKNPLPSILNPLSNKPLNYLKRIMRFGCGTPEISVIIETAFLAAVPVLFEVKAFSCIDILKTRAGISWQCGRQLKAAIGAAHKGKSYDRAHFLYSFAAPVEGVLWNMFVAEMSEEFVANWTSLMYSGQGCDLPVAGELSGGIEGWDNSPGSVYTALLSGGGFSECGGMGANSVEVAAGCTADFAYHVETGPATFFPGRSWSSTAWIEDDLGTRYMQTEHEFNLGDKGGGHIGAIRLAPRARLGAARTYQLKIQTSDWARITGGTLHVTLRGHALHILPSSCKPKRVSPNDRGHN